MATPLENLQAAYASAAAKLAELYADPKPNYSIDGRSYSHADFRARLVDELKSLQKAIQDAQGPFEIVTFGV